MGTDKKDFNCPDCQKLIMPGEGVRCRDCWAKYRAKAAELSRQLLVDDNAFLLVKPDGETETVDPRDVAWAAEQTVAFAAGRGSGKTEMIHEQVTGKPLFPSEPLNLQTDREHFKAKTPEKRVVVTISSGTFEDRCALAQIIHQVLDNFDIRNERSKDLIPYSELEMLESDTSVSICVETE